MPLGAAVNLVPNDDATANLVADDGTANLVDLLAVPRLQAPTGRAAIGSFPQ